MLIETWFYLKNWFFWPKDLESNVYFINGSSHQCRSASLNQHLEPGACSPEPLQTDDHSRKPHPLSLLNKISVTVRLEVANTSLTASYLFTVHLCEQVWLCCASCWNEINFFKYKSCWYNNCLIIVFKMPYIIKSLVRMLVTSKAKNLILKQN